MKRFLLFAFFLSPLLSLAQTNYKPGYVITNTGDSVPGFINYKERDLNPSSFSFKSAENAAAQTYRIRDCKAYGLISLEKFERHLVDISQSKEELSDLSYGLDTSKVRDSVFLKVIQTGKNLTLYSYTDRIKIRFYVKESAGLEPYELLHATYKLDEAGKIKDYNQYLRQLSVLMMKNNILTPENQSKLYAIGYRKAQIMDIISLINAQEIERGMKSTRFFVGAALNASKASYGGISVFNKPGSEAKTSYSPMLTIGVDLFANPHIGRVIYRAELSFVTAKSDIFAPNTDPTVEYKDHSFDTYGLIFSPQVIWNVYNSNPFKVFIGGGADLNVSETKNNVISTKLRNTAAIRREEDRVDFNKFYVGVQASAGVVIKKKYEVFGSYMFNTPMNQYLNYSVNMQRMNVGVKYLFGN
jgi:hypothetical protein